MGAALTAESLKSGVVRIAARMEAASAELNQLDGAVGDGDLGVTMVRGTRAIVGGLTEVPDDIGQALMKCAQGFTRTSGSTFGTLVATGLMAAAKAARGQREIPWRDVSTLLDAAVTAMLARGKSSLGDKTALDAIDAIRRAAAASDGPDRMIEAALEAVHLELDRMRQQPARQGRARIFADKTIGRDDPGMIAVLRVLESLA